MIFLRPQKEYDSKHSVLFTSLIHKSENTGEGKRGCTADAYPGNNLDKDTGTGLLQAENTGEIQSPPGRWQLLFKQCHQLKGLKGKEGLER